MFLIAVLTLLPLILAGDFILNRLTDTARISWLHRWPTAYALGGGLTAVLLFILSFLIPHKALTWTRVLICSLATIHIVGHHQQLWSCLSHRQISRRLLGGLLVLFGLGWFLAAISSHASLGYDAVAIWALKAKIIFLENGWPDLAENITWLPQPSYPLLYSVNQAWVYAWLGQISIPATKAVVILAYLGIISSFYSFARRFYKRNLAFVFTLLMASTPNLATVSLLSGYAEVPLSLYLLLGVIFVYEWLQSDKASDLWVGGIIFALSIWVKREGLIYWGVTLGIILTVTIFIKKRPKYFLYYIIPFLVLVLPWLLYLQHYQLPNADFDSISWHGFWQNRERLVISLVYILRLLTNLRHWGIMWWIFLLLTVWLWPHLRQWPTFYFWYTVVIPIFLFSVIYTFSNWSSFIVHLSVSADRLILHVVPLAWLYITQQSTEMEKWLLALWQSSGVSPPINK